VVSSVFFMCLDDELGTKGGTEGIIAHQPDCVPARYRRHQSPGVSGRVSCYHHTRRKAQATWP
jgi:hypothetical protein